MQHAGLRDGLPGPAGGETLLFLTDEQIRRGIEAMYFAYRAFTSDPDLILAEIGYGRAHHRALYFIHRDSGLTVTALLDDIDAGLITEPWVAAEVLQERLRTRTEIVELAGWREIDRVERARGQVDGAPRRKVTDRAELHALAAQAPSPAASRSLPWQRKAAAGSR
mgnify:CR=1 FL=1